MVIAIVAAGACLVVQLVFGLWFALWYSAQIGRVDAATSDLFRKVSLTFPTALFSPSSLRASLVGGTVSSGQSLSGITQFAMAAGGAYWQFEMGESTLWTKEKLNTWEAIAAATDNGATPFVVPLAQRRRQPFTDPKRDAGVGNSDDSTFSDGALWPAEYITASIVGSAALRATRLSILMDSRTLS
jgi:hypothetical protein